MKKIPSTLKLFTAFAFALFAAGCSAEVQRKTNMAAGSGFKIIFPVKPEQKAIFRKLPDSRLTEVTYQGATYYIMRDTEHDRAYVGGPAEYQSYRQLREAAKPGGSEKLDAVKMRQNVEIDWSAWEGWGAVSSLRR